MVRWKCLQKWSKHRCQLQQSSDSGAVIANANPFGFDDPETVPYALNSERSNCALEASQAGLDRLVLRPEHDDTRRALGCIAPSVGEIQVEGNQDAIFPFAHGLNLRVDRPGQVLVLNVVHVPAQLLEPRSRGARQVFVEFESQRPRYAGIGSTRSWANAAA